MGRPWAPSPRRWMPRRHWSPIKIDVSNSEFSKTLILEDVFYAFRESLRNFIYVIEKKKSNILESETLEIIEIIEKGK